MKKDRNRGRRAPAPVIMGHDDRGEKREEPREEDETPRTADASAPDGISGYWS